MKTERAIIGVLGIAVIVLLFLQFSGKRKPAAEPAVPTAQAPAECVTNTVERWQTNIVNLWHTNATDRWHTNLVMQTVTNEVVREVPARLSDAARQAATTGYKYLHAPAVANGSDSLYGSIPVGVDVVINARENSGLGDAGQIRQRVEDALRAKNIPVDRKSSQQLNVSIAPVWTSDLPRVALLAFRLELRDKVALNRKGDVIQCNGVVWSSAGSKLVRTFNLAEEMNASLQEQLDKFCADYLKAKQTENDVKSRIPSLPADFLPQA